MTARPHAAVFALPLLLGCLSAALLSGPGYSRTLQPDVPRPPLGTEMDKDKEAPPTKAAKDNAAVPKAGAAGQSSPAPAPKPPEEPPAAEPPEEVAPPRSRDVPRPLGPPPAPPCPGAARTGKDLRPFVPKAPCPMVVLPSFPPPVAAPAFLEDPPPPAVTIRVRVPASARAGEEIEYHLCVENRGQGAAHHVLVRNPLPGNARFVRAKPEPTARDPELVWQLGTLAGGATCDIVLVLLPKGADELNNCARVQFEYGQCVSTRLLRPSIKLRKNGPQQGVLYDPLNFQLEVTNTGSIEATNVEVSDTLPDGLEHSSGKKTLGWKLEPIPPGDSRRVDYQVIAKVPGKLCNRAVATAAGGARDEVESCVTITEPRLSLLKTGPERQYANMPAVYRITVTNPGTGAVRNVVVTDPLPAQTAFVSAGDGGRFADNRVQWSIGTLEPGASRSVEIVLRAQVGAKICNRATATADRGLSAQAEACTEFVGVSALLLEAVDRDDPVEVGGETSYIVLVRNQGTSPATNVRIEALVPNELTVLRVTGPAETRKDGQRVLSQPMTLNPRGEARFVIYVKALQPGDVRFKVELFADQLTAGPVHEEESTTVYRDIESDQPAGGAPQSRRKGGN